MFWNRTKPAVVDPIVVDLEMGNVLEDGLAAVTSSSGSEKAKRKQDRRDSREKRRSEEMEGGRAPSPSRQLTRSPQIGRDISEQREGPTVRNGVARMVNAAAEAVENYLGHESDDDMAVPQIPVEDRYEGLKARQAEFIADLRATAKPSQPQAQGKDTFADVSPFAAYRERMGERDAKRAQAQDAMREAAHNSATSETGSEGRRNSQNLPSGIRGSSLSFSQNRAKVMQSNRSVDAPGSRRLSRSSEPTTGGAIASAVLAGASIGTQAQNMRDARELHAQGRNTSLQTRIDTAARNVRIVQPHYVLSRNLIILFGCVSLIGVAMGAVTLSIGVRNARYLRGPKAVSALGPLREDVNEILALLRAVYP